MEEVWKVPYDPTTNIVDVYLKYLRDKIEIEGESKLIHTIRNVGYILRDGSERMPCRSVGANPGAMHMATTAIGAGCAA
jgi:DNA-binding winged helix-turn-helix (wHTH) protein